MKKLYLIVAIPLVMLVLSTSFGCAKPALTPTATPTPKLTTTPTSTPTPTPASKPAAVQTFYVGATAMTSASYPPTVALCKVVNAAVPELNLVPRACPGGTTENLNLLKTGELKMGFCPWEFSAQAKEGTGFYKGQFLLPSLRAAFSFGLAGATIFVRKDSGVTDVRQLQGKSFGSGFAGSTSQFLSTTLLEQGVGVKPDWFINDDTVTMEAVKTGKIIGTWKNGFPQAAVLELCATVPIIILGVTEEDLDRANKLYPGMYRSITMRAGLYPGQDKPILTSASNSGWIIDASFPADLVYKMVKAIAANPAPIFEDAIASAMRLSYYNENWEASTLKRAAIPLHAGLVRYFKEKGITVPDNLIPPEAR